MATWYQESSKTEKRTFWACYMGWGLDALDVQMFSLAIPALFFGSCDASVGAVEGRARG